MKINYRNIPRFLLLLLGALMISLIMMERLELSRPMGARLTLSAALLRRPMSLTPTCCHDRSDPVRAVGRGSAEQPVRYHVRVAGHRHDRLHARAAQRRRYAHTPHAQTKLKPSGVQRFKTRPRIHSKQNKYTFLCEICAVAD